MELLHLKSQLGQDGQLWMVEFDHGKANEMGTEQLRDFEQLVEHLHQGPRVLITWSKRRSSRGTPIFIAGANVTERVGWSEARVIEHVRWQREVLVSLRAAPVFHVCVVNGVALGWGTEFLLCADYRIASDGASFALPETGLGIVPGAGGTADLAAHVGVAHALRLGMTGERIDADEAWRIGLVQERVADVDAGLARAVELAELVVRRSPTAVAGYKAGVLAAIGRSGPERLAIEGQVYDHCVRSGQAAVGRAHFAEIRKGAEVPWGPRQPLETP